MGEHNGGQEAEKREKPPKVKRMYEKDLLSIMAAIVFTRGGSSEDAGEAVKIARSILAHV
jgi:hypothetical protein